MRDVISMLEFMRDEPTAWVVLLLVLIGFAWLYRERSWWRDRALKLEAELREDTEHRERVVTALRKMADMLHMVLDRDQNRWFRRWKP